MVALGLLAGATASGGNLSPEAQAQIESDWQLQEKVSWKRQAGSTESFEALLRRGNLLVADGQLLIAGGEEIVGFDIHGVAKPEEKEIARIQ